jgi:hypothetical protein
MLLEGKLYTLSPGPKIAVVSPGKFKLFAGTIDPHQVCRMVMPPSTGIVVPCRYDEAGKHTLIVTADNKRDFSVAKKRIG